MRRSAVTVWASEETTTFRPSSMARRQPASFKSSQARLSIDVKVAASIYSSLHDPVHVDCMAGPLLDGSPGLVRENIDVTLVRCPPGADGVVLFSRFNQPDTTLTQL